MRSPRRRARSRQRLWWTSCARTASAAPRCIGRSMSSRGLACSIGCISARVTPSPCATKAIITICCAARATPWCRSMRPLWNQRFSAWRSAFTLALLATLVVGPGAASAQAGCAFRGGFAQLQALIPDRVGTCLEDEQYRPDLGQSSQRTSNGTLIWHSVDGALTFSDGFHTWLLDPNGQVQVRNLNERFPFEFNGDGFPIVGQPAPATNGPCPTTPLPVLAVENFYANLVQQIGGQCVSVTTILNDPDADPHEFEPTVADVRAFQGAQLVIENGLGYDDFADKIIETMSQKPVIVRAGDVVGLEVGANP